VDRHHTTGRQAAPRQGGVNRRRFLGATAGATALGLGAAPGRARAARQEAATLEFWGFDEGRLNFAKAAAELPAFKDAHPNVTINFREFQFDQMHDRLLAALASGRGAPDIADVEIARFSMFIKGDRVPFVPLNDLIGAEIENVYAPAAVDPWSFGGQIYGLGNELNAVVFAYRQDVMDAAGVETPFETWDQVIEAGKAVSTGETKMLGLHDIAFGDFFMTSQFAGTSFFDAEGNYQADNELGVEALTFLRDLVYEHQVAGIAPADAQNDWFGPAYWAAFEADRFVAMWGPPWHLGNLVSNVPDQEGLWAVQKVPSGLGESRPTANFGGTGQCITEQSQNQEIAWDLLRVGNLTVEGNLNDFAARTVYPAYIPAYERPELQEPSAYFSGAEIGQVYASVAGELPPFNQSPMFYDATEAMIRVVITPVMNDQKEPVAALEELGAEVAGMAE